MARQGMIRFGYVRLGLRFASAATTLDSLIISSVLYCLCIASCRSVIHTFLSIIALLYHSVKVRLPSRRQTGWIVEKDRR